MESEAGQIDFWLRFRIDSEVVGVGDDSNHWNLVWVRAKYSQHDVGAYRIPS